jgi:DNA-binding NarL/FixJ family response regulator
VRSEFFNPSAVSSTRSPPEKSGYNLTPHETRLLKILIGGYNDKTAANELGSGITTTGTHLQRICRKLPAHSKSAVAAEALQERLSWVEHPTNQSRKFPAHLMTCVGDRFARRSGLFN